MLNVVFRRGLSLGKRLPSGGADQMHGDRGSIDGVEDDFGHGQARP